MKVVLAYIFPCLPDEHHVRMAIRFITTYREHPSGLDHQLVVVCNGGGPSQPLSWHGEKLWSPRGVGWQVKIERNDTPCQSARALLKTNNQKGKMKVIVIEVTKRDIQKGIQNDDASCAIALACRRLGFVPQVDNVEIVLDCEKTGESYRASTPKKAAVFIDRFDDFKPVKPFKFRIKAQAKPQD